MRVGKALAVTFAIGGFTLLADVRLAEAPATGIRNPAYATDHRLVPVPVMGIRGDVMMLAPRTV
jgi:hypothetical protein